MAAAKVARALIVLELLDSVDETRPKRTRGKTRRWIKRREEKGYFANIVRELRSEDTDSFTEMFRMKFSTMKEILRIIEAEITPPSYGRPCSHFTMGTSCADNTLFSHGNFSFFPAFDFVYVYDLMLIHFAKKK